MNWLRHILFSSLALLILGIIAAATIIYEGVYNVSALTQHTTPVFEILAVARNQSVESGSKKIKVPNLDQFDWRTEGIRLYETHCLQCHGAPGVAPDAFALGMNPPPSAVVRLGLERTEAELFWVIKHGIKMSAMPAWEFRLDENQMWTLVATLKALPALTTKEYAALRPTSTPAPETLVGASEPNVYTAETREQRIRKGRQALQQYNCSSCHVIDDITAAVHHVGPPLNGVTRRSFISGILPMTDENLILWIQHPTRFDPETTMPDLDVTREHAELMVAYLHSIEDEE